MADDLASTMGAGEPPAQIHAVAPPPPAFPPPMEAVPSAEAPAAGGRKEGVDEEPKTVTQDTAPPPVTTSQQLVKDIFGESDEEVEGGAEAPVEPVDDDDLGRSKAAERLEGVKRSKRQRRDEESEERVDKKRSKKKEKEQKRRERSSPEPEQERSASVAATREEEEEEHYTKKQSRGGAGAEGKSDFDKVLDSIKRGHRKKRDEAAEEASRTAVKELLAKMQQAAVADSEAYARNQPATHKLKLLPDVLLAAGKSSMQAYFVPDVLPVVTNWLQPTSDGSLPNLAVREAMLRILRDLPGIETEHLKSSGVGKAVMALFKHPAEVPKNKKIAQELVERWSRPLFKLTDSYRDMADADENRNAAPRRRLLNVSSEATAPPEWPAAGDKRKPQVRFRARIPQRDHLDFVKVPASNKDVANEAGDIRPPVPPSLQKLPKHGRFSEKLKSKASTSNIPRFVKMSVEGRGIGE